MPLLESRRFRRYSIHAPCLVRPSRNRRSRTIPAVPAETKDISSGGLCFEGNANWDVGTEFQCVIQIPPFRSLPKPIRLQCRGKIVRVVELVPGRIEVGATIERYSYLHPRERVEKSEEKLPSTSSREKAP
jgi:PilZ domain-containing protein